MHLVVVDQDEITGARREPKTYNTTCQRAWLTDFAAGPRQRQAGHGAMCPGERAGSDVGKPTDLGTCLMSFLEL